MRAPVILVGAAALAASSGPVLYPLWLVARTRRLCDAVPPRGLPGGWPSVTVVVPAFREQHVIAGKVAGLFGDGYLGRFEVLVVADDDATAAAARRTTAQVIAPGRRLGKSAAINLGIAAANTELVVLNDANTVLDPGSIARMARWFADPSVGAVAGEKRAGAEGPYWRFESFLKQREDRLGTTIGLVGELAALRRDRFCPLPPDVAVDDLWLALDVVEQGAVVRYERTAVATEDEDFRLRQVWERRTRVVAGALDVVVRRRHLLRGHPPVSAQLWGHRLLRMTVGPLAHAALLIAAAVRAGRRPHRHPVCTLFLFGHVLAGAALARKADGRTVSRAVALAAQVVLLQAVGLGGLVRYLRGDRPVLWPKPERQSP